MIILLILITLSLDNVWMLLGENCCCSLLAPKGLKGEGEEEGAIRMCEEGAFPSPLLVHPCKFPLPLFTPLTQAGMRLASEG